MLFPNIEHLATKQVVVVEASASVRVALRRMVDENLRDVVVREADGGYSLLTATDLIRLRIGGQVLEQPISEVLHHRLPTVHPGQNILDVLKHFSPDSEYLCVVDDTRQLRGIVSYTDVATSIDPQVMIERQSIGDILVKNAIHQSPKDTPLGEVLRDLVAPSDAVVITDGRQPVGIVTTKDAVRLLNSDVPFDDPVHRHMSLPLQTVSPDMTIKEAVEYLREKHFKRLVVAGDSGLVGVITQRELVVVAYSRWAEMLRNHAMELREVVGLLERKTARLEQIAATDRLTGVSNRARFEQVLQVELERCERYAAGPLSILMLDVDHFKAVNDRFGHLIGDEVLKQVARLADGSMRSADTFARWGGEEFVALLPHTALENAALFADRLRERFELTSMEEVGSVRVSIGVAEYSSGESAESLLRRADEALYRAKGGGRNRVELATEGSV